MQKGYRGALKVEYCTSQGDQSLGSPDNGTFLGTAYNLNSRNRCSG